MARRFRLITLGALLAVASPSLAQPVDLVPPGAASAATLHPSELMMKAPPLMSSGREEEATFWFYAGQLRWRSRITANPDQDPTGEPALFSSLMETIGPSVNGWAFGDIPQLQGTIDAVLAWDAANPDPSVPVEVHANTRAGLVKLRDQIGREADDIRSQRTANGLSNR